MRQLWRAKRYKVYSGKRLFWHYCLQLPFVYQTISQISFNLLYSGDKGFYQSSLGKEIDFREIINVSPNILAQNQNFKKLRNVFVDERELITTTLTSSCHWKTLFLSQSCTEKQAMSPKTAINWLFKDIWCYLFIPCFDWKIGPFQQIVVRVYYIIKPTATLEKRLHNVIS